MKRFNSKFLYSHILTSLLSILLGFIISPRIEGNPKVILIITLISGLSLAVYKILKFKKTDDTSTLKYEEMVKLVEDLQLNIQKLQEGVAQDLDTAHQLDQEIKHLEAQRKQTDIQLSNIISSLKQRPVDEATSFLKNL